MLKIISLKQPNEAPTPPSYLAKKPPGFKPIANELTLSNEICYKALLTHLMTIIS